MERWQRLSKQTVLEHSSFLSVESHTVQLPNGEIIPDWPIVITPDYVDANRGAGIAHLYLARAARQVQPRDADDLEEQQLLMMGRDDLEDALESGGFKVLAWTTVVVLGLRYLDQGP
jgi:ADP-ribose pyrophosphatase